MADRLDSMGLSTLDRDVLSDVTATLVHSETEQGMAQFLFWTSINGGSWETFMEGAGGFPIEGAPSACSRRSTANRPQSCACPHRSPRWRTTGPASR